MGSTIPVRARSAPARLLMVEMTKSTYLKVPSSSRLAAAARPAARRRQLPEISHSPNR